MLSCKKNKKIILIDDNPYKTYPKIPYNVTVKKIEINQYKTNSEKKLSKMFLNDNIKKIIFFNKLCFFNKVFFFNK